MRAKKSPDSASMTRASFEASDGPHTTRLIADRRFYRPRPHGIPVHAPGGVHDRAENGEQADRPNNERVVFVHQQQVQIGVE